jgi:hypothetical protein
MVAAYTVLAAFRLLTATVSAQDASPSYFAYFPDGIQLELGRGFIQNDITRNFGVDCLTFRKEQV